MLTLAQAAERLNVTGLYLMHVIDVGDLRPSLYNAADGDVWHQDTEIAFSETDLDAFGTEIERRRFRHLHEQLGYLVAPEAEFAFGPGWEQIVRSAAQQLTTLPGRVRFSGGKEKFGSLTLYVSYDIFHEKHGLKDILYDAVATIRETARKRSLTFCEECGEPGRLRMGYSIAKTTCDRHAHLVGPLRDNDGEIVDLPPSIGPIYRDGTQGTY